MMITQRLAQILLAFVGFGILLFSGCANLHQPETGAIARQEARTSLADGGVKTGVLSTNDLDLVYSITETGNTFNLTGTLEFDRSLTDSFPSIRQFRLKMSFLDNDGRVLQTVDITPLYGYYSYAPGPLPVKVSSPRPSGAGAIAFNYFGSFRGNGGDSDDNGGVGWSIFYFPYD